MDLISRTINNRQIFVRPHATVLQACEAAGVDVPRFCYHEKLSVAGNCRRCLVEVQKSPKPVVSCAMPVAKGRIVYTDTPLVRKAREAVLEFLLLNHPLDCPICDQGGECDLQDEALTFGADRGRYYEFKRSVEDKECGPIVKTIRTRCIHCTRCIRFSTEVAGHETLGAFGRGEEMEIGTYINTFLRTELSGNLVDLCPVGALTSKPYAYQARSWELQRVETLDFFDALCSDIVVNTRKRSTPSFVNNKRSLITQEEILRIQPRSNGYYFENWITDRTRYAFDGLNYSRLNYPLIRNVTDRNCMQSWSDVLNSLSYRLISSNTSSQSNTYSFVVGPQVNLERVYSLLAFSKLLGTSNVFQGYAPVCINNDAPFFYGLNQSVQYYVKGLFSSFIFVGTNLRFEASLLTTIFRREQNRRSLVYLTIGAFASLRYQNKHQGNSFRTLVSALENRFPFMNFYYSLKNSTGILLGVESLRRQSASFLHGLVRVLGKRFFTKTIKNDRLGYVHSSVGSLAFAHLGGNTSTLSFNSKQNPISFNVHVAPVSKSFYQRFISKNIITQTINFDTHITNISATQNLPINSLYEREGHLMTLEGRLRKHSKAVTSITNSLESILSVFCRNQGFAHWFFWTKALIRYNVESPRESLLESVSDLFAFNPFSFEINTLNVTKLNLFHQTVRDFYLQEPIAAYSSTMGECSLFIAQEGNFAYTSLFCLDFLIYYSSKRALIYNRK